MLRFFLEFFCQYLLLHEALALFPPQSEYPEEVQAENSPICATWLSYQSLACHSICRCYLARTKQNYQKKIITETMRISGHNKEN